MRFKKLDWGSGMIGFVFVGVTVILGFLAVSPIQVFLTEGCLVRGVFSFDLVSFYLVFLSCLL